MPSADSIWRPIPLVRWLALAAMPISVGVPIALVAYDLVSGGDRWWAWFALLPVTVLVIARGYWYALTPFVAARSEGIEIRNPHERQMVPWDDIVDITPGYFGLTIRRRTDPDVVAWAVQKSNIARWTRHHTRADDVAEILRKEAIEHGAELERPEVGTATEN